MSDYFTSSADNKYGVYLGIEAKKSSIYSMQAILIQPEDDECARIQERRGAVSDYPSSVVLQMVDELGVNSVGSDDTVELAPMTDPRWQTVVGQSIWENVLETRMAASYVPLDEEEDDPFDR
ncbi:uncharacterized protein ARMOST_14963 [Armillaria ostoyae]|uniref:Uncharacterized protein n=1 Tax=Armillaria ostoyae TaxID=47428 RepID=A0A284RS56_ARMOS|nr:uncharacterized protein ARMOST_14963 [Armillaria ostoyae]